MTKLLNLTKPTILDFQQNKGEGYTLGRVLELEEAKAKFDKLAEVRGLRFGVDTIRQGSQTEKVMIAVPGGAKSGALIADNAVSQMISKLLPKKTDEQKLTDVVDVKFIDSYIRKVNEGIAKDNTYRHRHNPRPFFSAEQIENRSPKEFFNLLGDDIETKADMLNFLIEGSPKSSNQFLFRIMMAQGMAVITSLLGEQYSIFDNVSLIRFLIANFDQNNWYVSKYRSDALNSNTQIRLHERLGRTSTQVGDIERTLAFHNSEIGKLSYFAREGIFEHRCLNSLGNWTDRQVLNPRFISEIATPDEPKLLTRKSEERIRHSHKPEDSFIESLERLLLDSGAEELKESYLTTAGISLGSPLDFIESLGKAEGLSGTAIESVKVAYDNQERFGTPANSLIRVIDSFTEAAHREIILPNGKTSRYAFGSGNYTELERIGSQLVFNDPRLKLNYVKFEQAEAELLPSDFPLPF